MKRLFVMGGVVREVDVGDTRMIKARADRNYAAAGEGVCCPDGENFAFQ